MNPHRLALGTALVLGLSTVAVSPAALAAPDATQTAVCDEVGQVTLETTGGKVTGITDGTSLALAATGQACFRAARDAAGHLSVDRTAPIAHVVVDDQSALANQTRPMVTAAVSSDPAAYGAVTSFPYASELAAFANTRSGSITFAQRAAGSSTIHSFTKGSGSNVTASIVKVQVMSAVMVKAQREGRALTSWETSQIVPMIRYSDNDATTNLWNYLGKSPAIAPVMASMGLRQTTYDTGGRWGLTVTTAPDQVVLMDHFARKNPVLNDSMRSYGLSLMRTVASDQDWGVTAGPGTDIAKKNGWLPRTDGWHVNSVGYSHKSPMPYSAAALSHSTSGSMSTQIATIEGMSRIVWAHRGTAPAPTAPARVRGDITGDGIADLVGLKDSRLFLFRGMNGGRLTAPQQVGGTGWSGFNWVGVPGDVTGDGKSDLVARRDDGTLWLYPSTGTAFSDGRQIGKGWGSLTMMTAVGDLNGNGTPELVALGSTGALLPYSLPRTGGAVALAPIGKGWGGMAKLLGTSYNGDSKADIMAVNKDGLMYRYYSTGTSLADGQQVGNGWNPGWLMSAPGDLNKDGTGDVVLQIEGTLRFYPVRRGGTFGDPSATGTTLTGFRVVS